MKACANIRQEVMKRTAHAFDEQFKLINKLISRIIIKLNMKLWKIYYKLESNIEKSDNLRVDKFISSPACSTKDTAC